MTARVCVARIGAAHGVRGALLAAGIITGKILVWDVASRRLAFTLPAAQALTNTDLYVPRDRLPAIKDDDTFYHSDLVGLDVVTADGAQVGTVRALRATRIRFT